MKKSCPFFNRQAGQFVVEYVLLLVVIVSLAMLITSKMVSRNSDEPGFFIAKWNKILTVIAEDYADDIPREKKK